MKILVASLIVLSTLTSLGQDKAGTSFYEKQAQDVSVCPQSLAALTDNDVKKLLTEMLERVGLKMSYIIVSCAQIDNCQAILYQGRPYILYNAAYLDEVKRLNFSEKEIVTTEKNWKVLTILAHELGHHLNNHLSNPPSNSNNIDLELSADKTAGFIIYLMGGTLTQAQLAFNDVPETDGYTHPSRQKRLDAVERGWNDAFVKYPRQPGTGNKPFVPPLPKNTVKDIDGNIYKTVKINYQVWMAENLNVSHYRNGDVIPQVTSPVEWEKLTTGAWCYFMNETENGKIYGKLYNWYAVNDPRGLAPEGWHVPTTYECWDVLKEYIGGQEGGGKLKALQYWESPNKNADNSTGFTALPGGIRNEKGYASGIGRSGYWWTASPASGWPNEADFFNLDFGSPYLYKTFQNKKYGFSVRCVKD